MVKEYTIGVEAFGRPQEFDPKIDTIVRVQIHRLRQKLKEYYDSDGTRDPVLIEIPKGHYLPSFENTEIPEAQILSHDSAPKQDVTPTAAQNIEVAALHGGHEARWYGRSAAGFAIIVATSVIAIFSAGLWIGNGWLPSRVANRIATASSESSFDKAPDPVKAFWATFLGKDPTPVIAYPDAVFLLDDTNDLFRFQRGATDFRGAPVDSHLAEQFAENPVLVARAGQLYYENAYLGFGELKAVGMLSNLFGQMGMKPIVKPSREVTVDDLKQHNVIMLGSSSQNFAVAQLNTMSDFSFKSANSPKEQWRLTVVNARPRPGEVSICTLPSGVRML